MASSGYAGFGKQLNASGSRAPPDTNSKWGMGATSPRALQRVRALEHWPRTWC